jgi:hypothetical protein
MANTPIPANNMSGPAKQPPAMPADLQALAKSINGHMHAMSVSAQDSLVSAFHAGADLNKAKAAVPHGNWAQWLEANCELSERTAVRYMRLADNRKMVEEEMKSNSATVADFTLRQAEKLITKPRAIGAVGTKPSTISELIPTGGATNDAFGAITSVQEKLFTTLGNLRRNDEAKAREAATAIVKRLKELQYI